MLPVLTLVLTCSVSRLQLIKVMSSNLAVSVVAVVAIVVAAQTPDRIKVAVAEAVRLLLTTTTSQLCEQPNDHP